MFVFVYGTLRRGDCRGGFLGEPYFPEAYVKGLELFDLGPFPGVLEGPGLVRGEVYEIDAKMLQSLDRIEGYRAQAPGEGLYDRQLVTARDPSGEEVEAWVYIYNNRDEHQLRPIASGDWFAHRNLYPQTAEENQPLCDLGGEEN